VAQFASQDQIGDPGVFSGDPKEFHTWFVRLQLILKAVNMPACAAIPYIISKTSSEVWDVLRPKSPDWNEGNPFPDAEDLILKLQYCYDDTVAHRERHKRIKYETFKQKEAESFEEFYQKWLTYRTIQSVDEFERMGELMERLNSKFDDEIGELENTLEGVVEDCRGIEARNFRISDYTNLDKNGRPTLIQSIHD